MIGSESLSLQFHGNGGWHSRWGMDKSSTLWDVGLAWLRNKPGKILHKLYYIKEFAKKELSKRKLRKWLEKGINK